MFTDAIISTSIEVPPDAVNGQSARDASRPGHIRALDGLRGIAVILVMVAHAAVLLPPGAAWRPIAVLMNVGWCGVELFFVLSGFLITRILLADTEHDRSMAVFRRFYARRVLRIFPLYYVSLFAIVLVRWFTNADFGPPTNSLWWYLLYLQNWYNAAGHVPVAVGHLWSLAIEEQFYLAWPFVVVICTPRRLAAACVSAIVGAIVVKLWAIISGQLDAVWVYHATVTHIDGLAMGAFVATLERQKLLTSVRSSVMIALGALSLLALVVASGNTAMWQALTPFAVMAPVAFSLLSTGVIIAILQHRIPRAGRALRSMPLTEVGRLSYALYIFHPLVLWGMDRIVPHGRPGWSRSALLLAVFAAASVLLARFSWRFIERPFLRLKASV